MTLAELGEGIGIDPGDIAVLATAMGQAMGQPAEGDLPEGLVADLLDVLDAKQRLRS